MSRQQRKKTKIIYCGIIIALFVVLQCIFVPSIAKAETTSNIYNINGREISYDDVEWPGVGGCWTYASQMYEKIWDVPLSENFEGFENADLNLLRGLSDEERLFNAENAEIFVKYAKPGALIRIFDAVSSDPAFDMDGIQSTGTYGHSIIIAAIYDEGFVAFESLSDGTREMFYTWQDFFNTWSANDFEGQSRYKYFKYIKWPDAPELVLNDNNIQKEPGRTEGINKLALSEWGLFFILLGISLVLFIGGIVAAHYLRLKSTNESETVSSLPLKIIFIASFFFMGGFFAWNCVLPSAGLLVILIYCYYKRGKVRFIFDERVIIGLSISIGYGLTSFWGVDKGLAPYGFIKAIIVFLFILALQQYENLSKELLKLLPWIGAVMTVVSYALSFIPSLKEWMLVNARLAGFFQYPNTFALFLLIGLLTIAFAEKHDWKQIILAVILLAGILLSGSRIVFVLTILAGFATIILVTKGKTRWILLAAECVVLLIVVVLAILWKDGPIGRFIQIAAGSSEILGRFLYMQDVIPTILRNPFGIGYMGYYYSQGSFQTGIYSVMSVHNGLLQLLVDIGWIPTLLIAIVFIKQIVNKKMNWISRMILTVILVHSLLDFTLDFMSVWLVIIICMEDTKILKKQSEAKMGLGLCIPLIAICSSLLFSLGVPNFSEYYLSADTTLRFYPNDTSSLVEKLIETDHMEDSRLLGNKIVKLNDYITLGHDALANDYYSKGQIEQMITEKEKAIATAKYSNYEYVDYFDKLANARDLYIAQGSMESADFCKEKLKEIPEKMNLVLNQTSFLGNKIKDKPQLSLTNEQKIYLNFIN